MPDSQFQWIAAAIIAALSVARLTRLVIFDEWPPSVWFRIKVENAIGNTAWVKLIECGYCLAPWIAAPVMAWAYFTDLHWSWWVFNGWLALAYVAPIIVSYDQPD